MDLTNIDYSSLQIILIVVITFLVLVGILFYISMNKSEKIKLMEEALMKLKESFNELDEQAKLIIKTDLELNKAQEELDKRLNGLDALQKTSRLISTTLDENEIFNRLNQSLMTNLDFEKNAIFLYNQQSSWQNCVNSGLSDEQIQNILTTLTSNNSLSVILENGTTLSSVTSEKENKQLIIRLFDVEHFVLSPILSQNGLIGIVFVGNQSNAAGITEGDEELISILANQIGQSLENARLFEEVYKASQILESKVQDRTRQLESALKEVQTISKTKTEFISAVSHELRTPLTSIKGYASILMDGKLGDIPEPVKARLGKINTHSDNLVKLINDLLDISRIESGKVEMTLTKCHLDSMIENVRDLLTPQMKDNNLNWNIEFDNQIPEIVLDVSQFERVFINLIGNAIKFTPSEGTISIKAQLQEDNTILLEISDTGIGIKEEDVARLFDEFYRVENEINQNVKGTGLGLPLAKKIVEAHDGKMWVTSILNEGTTFHITIPIKKDEEKRQLTL